MAITSAIRYISVMLALLSVFCGVQTNEGDDAMAKKNYAVYEAIFLDNDEIANLFTSVRGEEPPYATVTQDYHVTTEFMPAQAHAQWYGEQVKLHITSYAAQDVQMEDGQTTSNEGFKVEVTCENAELAAFLESLGKNFHITGSYNDAAKYTEYVDFSQGKPLDIYVTGTFGGFYSDGKIYSKKQ